MRWANSYWYLFLCLAAVCAGCPRDHAISLPDGPCVQLVAVETFEFSPDVVLLITGGTGGMLEICDCPPPRPAGMSRRSGLVASYRAAFGEKIVLLETGDLTHFDPGHRRNAYTRRAYQGLAYDVIALGDMEWMGSRSDRDALTQTGAQVISSNLRQSGGTARYGAMLRRGDREMLIVSLIGDNALWLMDLEGLEYTPIEQVTGRKAYCVCRLEQGRYGNCCPLPTDLRVTVVHGTDADVERVAQQGRSDLIIRGHTERSLKTMHRVDGVPVVQVGGMGYVGVVAMKLASDGRIEKIAYRRESLASRWPVDERMWKLFLEYASPDAERTERRGK
jgi:hypothetical protein